MPLIVSEALELDIFKDSYIVSGKEGLNNEINWVNILEILDDLSYLQKGEFLVTTAYGFKNDDIDYQRSIIRQLSSKGIAALAIQTGYYINKIPDSFLELADEYGVPLVVLHHSVSFREITRVISNQLISEQTLFYEYTSKVGHQLTEAILEQQGFSAIARVLSEIIEHPVRIYNCIYQLIASSENNAENDNPADLILLNKEDLMEFIDSSQTPYEIKNLEMKGILPQIIIPIKANHEIFGYISALKDGKKFRNEDIAALKHAVSICALELFKEDDLLKTRTKMVNDLITLLLTENPPPNEIIEQQTGILGYDIDSRYSAVVISIKTRLKKSVSQTKYSEDLRKKTHKLINLIIQQNQMPAIFSVVNEDVLFLLSGYANNRESIERLSERIHSQIEKYLPEIEVFIGVGSCHGNLLTVRKSYCEARKALKMQKLCGGKKIVVFYKDLGVNRLLIEIEDIEALESFYKDTVAKIVEYDNKHKTELLNTLREFLINDNVNKTAEKLFVHRHTLKYRLNKINKITRMDPMNAFDKYTLQSGIMVMDLLQSRKTHT